MTNSPSKIDRLTRYGIPVGGRIPHVMPSNPHNRFYLETQAGRPGHWLDVSGKRRLEEQSDPARVEGMPEE